MIRIVENPGWDDLQTHGADLYNLMLKMVERFPHDMTIKALLESILPPGPDRPAEKLLWLILEDERLIAYALTSIRTVDATGAKIAELMDLAGERVGAYADPLFAALMEWAQRNDATVAAVTGREGWKPLLAKYGFRPHAYTYRRVMNDKHNEIN